MRWGNRQSNEGQDNPQLDKYIEDQTSFQDRLVQLSFDMRGPGAISERCGEIIEQNESYDREYRTGYGRDGELS